MMDAQDCNCCAGNTSETPQGKFNRPGLPALAYRAGTHGTFKSSLLSRLSSTEFPALLDLTTRDDADWTIGLCDAVATMGDVVTFYQERIVNEAFLRTATERRSLLELARLVGYRLSPGVAANTALAFTLDVPFVQPAPPPVPVTIPPGTRVQSVPGADELPQSFETIEPIVARAQWNAIPVQSAERVPPHQAQRTLWLKGTSTLLQKGDALLLAGPKWREDVWDVVWLDEVIVDDLRGITTVKWKDGLGNLPPLKDAAVAAIRVHALRQRAGIFGHNAINPNMIDFSKMPAGQRDTLVDTHDDSSLSWKNFDIAAESTTLDLDAVYPKIVAGSWVVLAGAKKPRRATGGPNELYCVKSTQEISLDKFGLSGKVTRLEFDHPDHPLDAFDRRTSWVIAQSEELELAERPLYYPLFGATIRSSSPQPLLAPGQKIALEGKRQRVTAPADPKTLKFVDQPDRIATPGENFSVLKPPVAVIGGIETEITPADLDPESDFEQMLRWTLLDRDGKTLIVEAGSHVLQLQAPRDSDPVVSELVRIAKVPGATVTDPTGTALKLEEPLLYCYDRLSVRGNANVASATHGETVGEAGGGGDAAIPNQRFRLRQSPLTYVTTRNEKGRASTLNVRINDLLWKEVPSLFDQPPTARVYSLRQDDEGRTTVQFGDGIEGSRLPTGTDNVRFAYRKGLGREGNLDTGRITTLVSRPLGVKMATNPIPASGGTDPESREDARRNVPNTVLTLDRAVSILDYADFSRSFAGMAKAVAVWIPAGRARGVHITVAGTAGAAVSPGSESHSALLASLRGYGDELLPLTLQSFVPVTFQLAARMKIADDHIPEDVLKAVESKLRQDFGFDARDFGQPVTIDEVMSSIHSVDGVIAVDVDKLHHTGAAPGETPEARLFPTPSMIQPDGTVSAAQLLTLDTGNLQLSRMP